MVRLPREQTTYHHVQHLGVDGDEPGGRTATLLSCQTLNHDLTVVQVEIVKIKKPLLGLHPMHIEGVCCGGRSAGNGPDATSVKALRMHVCKQTVNSPLGPLPKFPGLGSQTLQYARDNSTPIAPRSRVQTGEGVRLDIKEEHRSSTDPRCGNYLPAIEPKPGYNQARPRLPSL